MSNPWLSIPLEDYEGHMSSPAVRQLTELASLFKKALHRCNPESVAVLGVAGGNGLEEIDPTTTNRIVGVDINPHYLDEVRQRFGHLAGLELHCCDLSERNFNPPSVALVHAALLFEHAGTAVPLDNALSLVSSGGHLSVILQLPSKEEDSVAPTNYKSMQTLKPNFALIDITGFQRLLRQKGFQLVEEDTRHLPAGKALWHGIFTRRKEPGAPSSRQPHRR
jgi:hypothetical protein